MSFTNIFLTGGIIAAAFVTLVWILSLLKKDAGIMDIFWGLGFIFVSIWYFLLSDGPEMRQVLILSLVIIWGLRLSIHIGIRNEGKPEDARYKKWRDNNGAKWWWVSFFKVFLLQGVLLWIISIPLLSGMYHDRQIALMWTDYMGIVLWLIGFLFEAISDYQLLAFKRDPTNKGKILDSGLWGLTRHPNYFGEAVLWWGYFMLAVAHDRYWIIISPILMTFLLLKVSGVAMLDKLMAETRPEYKEYMRRTSSFLPMPKRS